MTELTTTSAPPLAKPDAVRQRSPLYFAWRRFAANKAALGSGIVLLTIVLMALFAPLITATGPNEQAFLTNALNFPSAAHWFGIDDLGRDFFARIVYGARVSLGIGFSAAIFSLIVGLPLGALAGYLGGRFDWVVMRIIELFSVVPPLLAALLLATVTRGGVWAIILIAALFGWRDVCLLVRAQVKSFREKEFIMAAQALGASPWHIIWRHLIPNSVSPIIVGFVLAIPLAMMLEASLSFLGIGVQPPTPSWGQMINVGMNFMFYYWHMVVFPTAALALTILAASLLGDGLRDALDPTLKGRCILTTNLAQQFLLDPAVTFLNHGSFGACPRPVFEDYQRWQLELERQPVAFLDSRRGLKATLQVAREVLAKEMGSAVDNIAQVSNATTGLNIIIQSLPLKAGDEILTTNHEYNALEKTWAYVARKTGAKVVVVEVPLPLTGAQQFHDAVAAGFTQRTRVLFLSHITSPTALLFPIESLIAEARVRGVFSVIDGAHTPGHIPLNLDALGADFYSGNCHKWLMSPKGSAFVYARPEWHTMIDPLVISHGWTADNKQPGVRGPFDNSAFVDEIEMQGTRDPSAWLAVPAAIAFRRDHDWWKVSAECTRLAQETAGRLRELTGLPPLSSPEFCAPQMVAMQIPPCDPLAIHDALLAGYGIEIPVFEWQGRFIVRLSCQGYNTHDQMSLLIDALTDLLALHTPKRRASQG